MSVGRIKLKYIFRLERMFTISHCLVTYSRKFSRTDSYASVWRLKGVIRNHISHVQYRGVSRGIFVFPTRLDKMEMANESPEGQNDRFFSGENLLSPITLTHKLP